LVGGVTAQLLEPVARTRTDGVGGDADPDPRGAQLLEVAEVRRHRVLPKPLDPAAGVGDVEKDELDSRLGRSLAGAAALLEREVVELADRGVPGREQLAVDVDVARPDVFRGLSPREL